MRATSTAPRSFLFAISLLLAPLSARATTVVEQTFSDLVHHAEVIAVGTVTGIQERWDVGRQAPFTDVTFSQLTVLKGDPGGETMTLEFLGGHTPDGTLLSVSGVPQFTIGEKTVVFCVGNHRDFCPLVGVWQGLLRVTFNPQRGVETVSDNFRVPIVGLQGNAFLKLLPGTPQQEALPLPTLMDLITQELRRAYDRP
jgi:hypothetical protein